MKFSVLQISKLIDGEVEGNPEAVVSKLSKIEEGESGSLSFLANPVYTPHIYTTKASVVIVNKNFVAEQPVSVTLIRVDDAYQGFVKLLDVYNKVYRNKTGIESLSFISKTAKLGENVYVGAFSYIGNDSKIGNNVKIYSNVYIGENVTINDNTVLFPGVRVYPDCVVGKDCTLHSGAVIGSDGFGFAPDKNNNYVKVPQIGNVIIENNVEVGANTTIDRATMGSTIIHSGVKLDNLIQIAHNVEIGENTVIAAQTGVAGSTKIGKECMIGGQVGIVGHLIIADKVKIAAQSGIGQSILNEGEIVQGSPAFESHDYKRTYVLFKKLPEMEKRIHELEQELENIKSQIQ
jgi:UDP-3-O-[3-hydroxymyristoyl] glucosamine N-acyltransferase